MNISEIMVRISEVLDYRSSRVLCILLEIQLQDKGVATALTSAL